MLQRIGAKNGVVYYGSGLLAETGAAHAFSTRLGGVSDGAFRSLNLGNPQGPLQDDPANIAANYRLLAEAAALPGRQLRRASQVHGNRVIDIAYESAPRDDHPADALVSDDARCIVSVRTADCVPILLARSDGRLVAAVHAGWRGVVADVIGTAVARMRPTSDLPLTAAIGPCIGMDAFEVGPDVLAAFAAMFGDHAPLRHRPDGKGHVDLRQAVRLQLLRAGVSPDRIDMTDRCTFCHEDEFYSHRRDHGVTGRMAAIIGARA